MSTRVRTLPLLLLFAVIVVVADHALSEPHPARRAPSLKAILRADGRVELSWHGSGDSLCLERRSSTEELFSTVSCFAPRKTRFVDSTVTLNATFHYRLRPASLRYASEIGPECVITANLPPPPPPTLLRIAVDSVRVSLDSVNSFAENVLVLRRQGGIYSVVGTIPRGSLSFVEGGLRMQTHHYRLRYASDRFTSAPSLEDSIVLDLPPPVNVSATFDNDHTVSVHWQLPLPFPCHVQVEKRSPSGINIYSISPSESAWTDDSLRYDETYYYRVRLIQGRDSSDYSAPVSAHYVLRPAIQFQTDPVHDLVVHLTWGDSDSLTDHYLVERSSDSVRFDVLARLGGRTFAYTDSLTNRGVKFWYRLASVASNGVTMESEIISESVSPLSDGMVLVCDSAGTPMFYCDALEVSAAHYAEFCHETGRELPDDPGFVLQGAYWSNENPLPAVNVSWYDAIAFCNWRSVVNGLKPAYDAAGGEMRLTDGFRLPSREEFGDALAMASDTAANLAGAESSFRAPISPILTKDVAVKIYNLIGNVWEWNGDTVADGGHVILGGAYSTPRSLSRQIPEFCYRADHVSPTVGFRCILPANRAIGKQTLPVLSK